MEAKPTGRRGGQGKFSGLAIPTCLTLRAILRLPLRQTGGFVRSILRLAGLDLEAPGHSPLSRRGTGLEADLPAGRPAGPVTMGDIGRGYIASLARAGKDPGALLSYQLDLSLVLRVLGEDTPAESITEEAVAACFESDAVTKTRTGAPKAQVGIDKTRRVLRQALDWAAADGLIPASPVPERYRERKGSKPAKAAKPAGEEAL